MCRVNNYKVNYSNNNNKKKKDKNNNNINNNMWIIYSWKQ
jgi:hypothetical protein